MNTDKLILPDFLVADLYKTALVDLRQSTNDEVKAPVKQVIPEVPVQPEIKFLGENKKHVLVLVKEQEVPVINDADLEFLVKVLKACQLNMSDIAIINCYPTPFTLPILQEKFAPKQVLMFDVEPAHIKLPFTIPHFQVQDFAGCTYISCPPLKQISAEGADNRVLKTKLWATLQKAFQLS